MKQKILLSLAGAALAGVVIWAGCTRKDPVSVADATHQTVPSAVVDRSELDCAGFACGEPGNWSCILDDTACIWTPADVTRCCRSSCSEGCIIPVPPPPPPPPCGEIPCLQTFTDEHGNVFISLPGGQETQYTLDILGKRGSQQTYYGTGPAMLLPELDLDTISIQITMECANGDIVVFSPPFCEPGNPEYSEHCNPCMANIRIDNIKGAPKSWAIAIVPLNINQYPIGPGQLYGQCKNCINRNIGDTIPLPIGCNQYNIFDIYYIATDKSSAVEVTESWVDGTADIYNNGNVTIDYGGHDVYQHFTIDLHQKCTVDYCPR